MFKCKKCGIEKPLSEFSSTQTKLGHKTKCKSCWSEYMKKYYKSNPKQYTKHRGYVKKNDSVYKKQLNRHSLTEERFKELLALHDGKCHACREELATCVDHDHLCCPVQNKSCGDCIRGLLCNGCNTALGHVKDSVDRLKSLIVYLS